MTNDSVSQLTGDPYKVFIILLVVFRNVSKYKKSYRRIGVSRSGYRRPVKIAFRSSEIVRQILIKSTKLKNMDKYKSVFLAPDRCPEERIKHRELVLKLKERRTEDNSQRFVIRGGQIVNI